MSLRVKAGIDLEELKKYGFKTGKEWADAGERCLEGIGYKYQHEWYHKFLMDADEPSKIAYIAEDYDIPCVQISVRTEHRDLYVDVAVEGTYHVGAYEVLRARKPKENMVIVYRKGGAKEHLSIMDKDFYLVNEFLRTREAVVSK